MKAKPTVLSVLLASNLFASAEELHRGFDLFAPTQTTSRWQYHPVIWGQLSTQEPSVKLSIGPNEFLVRGALVDAFQRPRDWSELSLGEKILNFPVLNLFIPQKMPRPPGGTGRYFSWGDPNQSWTVMAGGGAGAGTAGVLVSVGW